MVRLDGKNTTQTARNKSGSRKRATRLGEMEANQEAKGLTLCLFSLKLVASLFVSAQDFMDLLDGVNEG